MSHISFSEIKNWSKCPFYHKLSYIDKIKLFQGNLHTAFGTAIHSACEKVSEKEVGELIEIFLTQFEEEVQQLKECDKTLHDEMKQQGPKILRHLKGAMNEYFGEFEVLSVEEPLYENIWSSKELLNFKGFIDMVISSNNKIHIIDWKTSTKGWSPRQRDNEITQYQLVYYKYYYAQKYGINPDDIKVHFGLLKRQYGGKNRVELFEIESDRKKITESLNYMEKFLYNVKREKFIKNRLSCTYCEFKGTEHCP